MAAILQITGAALLVAGGFLIYPAIGFIVAGVAALTFGIAQERNNAK